MARMRRAGRRGRSDQGSCDFSRIAQIQRRVADPSTLPLKGVIYIIPKKWPV